MKTENYGVPLFSGIFFDTREQGGRNDKRDRSDKNTCFPCSSCSPCLSCLSCLSCFSCFSCFSSRATKSPFFLCHFWWQKWRKSHAPHLWRRRESQSLKRMLRRQSVCRLRFFTALRLSPAATAKSVASPPTMRSADSRCAFGAGIKKDTRERGGQESGLRSHHKVWNNRRRDFCAKQKGALRSTRNNKIER